VIDISHDAFVAIFARGGSKGLPGKNLKKINGLPLIGWSIKCAFEVDADLRVLVSTDSEEIAATASEFGAEVPFLRPASLAHDTSSEWSCWRHLCQFLLDSEGYLPKIMISLPATAPLRKPSDVQGCLEQFLRNDCDAVLTATKAIRHPQFNILRYDSDGCVTIYDPTAGRTSFRQQVAPVYDATTVCYVVSTEFILSKAGHLFDGNVSLYEVPAERAVDIDSEFDFRVCDFLLSEQKSKNV